MITTRREVDIDNGNTVTATAVKRITAQERTFTVPSEIEVEAPVINAQTTTTRITPALEQDELMPVVRRKEEYEEVEEKKESRALSSRTKAMVFVYMATALILALIVLATGLAITSANSEVAALESEVRTQSVVLAESENALAHYGDDLTITGSATEMGMVKNEGATQVELVELNDSVSYNARTNAFDRFCDFLSKIIGG